MESGWVNIPGNEMMPDYRENSECTDILIQIDFQNVISYDVGQYIAFRFNLSCKWQSKNKPAAFSRLTLDPDRTSITFYKFFAENESKPGSGFSPGTFGAVLGLHPE